MRIPFRFTEIEVTPEELREAQAAFLAGSMSDRQRSLVDACMSWIICNASWATTRDA